MHGCIDAWVHGWMHACMDAWMDACMDGWMVGWLDRCLHTTPGFIAQAFYAVLFTIALFSKRIDVGFRV